MKRLLFCAGILALAASCTEDELGSSSSMMGGYKGIAFESGLAASTDTKADMTYNEDAETYDFFWYAEKDKIDIWGLGTNKGANASNWSSVTEVTYKATQSQPRGVFTGVSDSDILEFETGYNDYATIKDLKDDEKAKVAAKFFAVYPSGLTVAPSSSTQGQFDITLTSLATQTQDDYTAASVSKALLMYSYTTAYPSASYDAVGEKIGLNFVRPFTAAIFRTKGVDAEYSKAFGNLKKITFTMKGNDKVTPNIASSKINYGGTDAKYTVNVNDLDAAALTPGSDASEEIVLTLGSGSGLAWTDANRAYMAISNVDRKAFRAKDVKENIEVKYEFANITLNQETESNADWPAVVGNNHFIEVPELDIASYDYLLTDDQSGNVTLIVNSGSFSDVLDEAKENVVWAAGNKAITEVTNIISEVELSAAELKLLAGFTGLKSITLKKNTSIPAKTFTSATTSSLETINFPAVTTIADGAFDGLNLKNVALPAYNFADATVRGQILKAASLETLDMSGVDDMTPNFPAEGITLTDFASLTEITVKDGVKVGSDSFNGCKALAKVNGIVNIVGTNAFANASDAANTALTEIHIANTAIPAGTFAYCEGLKNIYYNDTEEQVVPTSVGAEAFKGCKALVNMDLSKIDAESTVGASAFEGCAAFVGIDEGGKNVVRVGGKEIGAKAFNDCAAIKYIEFKNAVKVGDNVLAGTTAMAEIQFLNPVDFTACSATAFGGSTTNVILYVAQGQEGVVNKVLKVGEKLDIDITFKNITVK